MLHTDELEDHPFLSRIGPDVLDPELSSEALAERLQSKDFKSGVPSGLFISTRDSSRGLATTCAPRFFLSAACNRRDDR